MSRQIKFRLWDDGQMVPWDEIVVRQIMKSNPYTISPLQNPFNKPTKAPPSVSNMDYWLKVEEEIKKFN